MRIHHVGVSDAFRGLLAFRLARSRHGGVVVLGRWQPVRLVLAPKDSGAVVGERLEVHVLHVRLPVAAHSLHDAGLGWLEQLDVRDWQAHRGGRLLHVAAKKAAVGARLDCVRVFSPR